MQLRPALPALAGLLVLASIGAAQAADWRRPDPDGKYAWVLVNAKSIRPDPSTGRMRFIYAHASSPDPRSLVPRGRSRVKAAFDCKTGQLYTYRDGQWRAGSRRDFVGPVRSFVCQR
jgi:hypothetical protein